MLQLPRSVSVRLVDPTGTPLAEPDVLVGINMLSSGRYYYGNLVGLTDSRGVAVVTGDDLEARYRADQAEFPMDYKLELIECDADIELVLLSVREIEDALSAIDALAIPSRVLRSVYARARNAKFTTALQKIEGSWRDDEEVICSLPTRRRDSNDSFRSTHDSVT